MSAAVFDFVFYYPLVMSAIWMGGALLFFFTREVREPRYQNPPKLPNTPPVTVLVPCYNEGPNVEETLRHALSLDYPDFEVIAINDGSRDDTGAVLDRMVGSDPRLRVVHLASNQGKAMALQAGALLARHEILIGIDGDALLDRHAAHWIVRHFENDPRVAAVTGNPRIRNRSTLLARVQIGEFSSTVGMIKRAQKMFGCIFTVSGVIAAFRKSAVHSVGYWSPDMLTEDIDISWKLQRAGWVIDFEPHALAWILTPETVGGLWRQRLRWATGGAQVFFKNLDVVLHPFSSPLWPLFMEMIASLVWSYLLFATLGLWVFGELFPPDAVVVAESSPVWPGSAGEILGTVCLLQFALGVWLDGRYDRGLGRNYFWLIWYPLAFWVIHFSATVAAYPRVLIRRRNKRARWTSPDRGIRPPD